MNRDPGSLTACVSCPHGVSCQELLEPAHCTAHSSMQVGMAYTGLKTSSSAMITHMTQLAADDSSPPQPAAAGTVGQKIQKGGRKGCARCCLQDLPAVEAHTQRDFAGTSLHIFRVKANMDALVKIRPWMQCMHHHLLAISYSRKA